MFQQSFPQTVKMTRYTVTLVNHNTGWEFYGVRLTELNHLVWCLAKRFQELEAVYEEMEETVSPVEPCQEMRLMDLLNLAINYVKRASDHGIRLPEVEAGKELALQVGPGVLIVCQGMLAVEIPTCNPPDSSYN